jgi:hypothetical protein
MYVMAFVDALIAAVSLHRVAEHTLQQVLCVPRRVPVSSLLRLSIILTGFLLKTVALVRAPPPKVRTFSPLA